MKGQKILVVTPIYDKKEYGLDKHLEHIGKQSYTDFDHIIVDNSETDVFYKKLIEMGLNAFRVPRGGNTRAALNNAMNFARGYMLEKEYSHMLIVESDLFPDSEVINRLLSHSVPVVGSFYLLGFKNDNMKYHQIKEMYRQGMLSESEFKLQTKYVQPERACIFELEQREGSMTGTRNISPEETYAYFNTGLRKIHGCGLGCTLIRRDIIQRFPFWTDSRFENKHHDVYFYMDLHNKHVPVYVDTDYLIPHQPSNWLFVEDR